MKNIKIFAFLAIFLLSAAVSSAWAKDVTLTYKIDVRSKLVAHIYNAATGEEVASWDHGIMTLWPAGEGHTMNDDYKITFTPNRDLDKTGENENNESTSTTAFRTKNNTIFTVSVGEGFYLKSVTFKEDGTEKASSSNIAPNSTSIRVEVPENKFFNYITVVLTNDFHYSLKYDENLTVSPSPSMTYNNIPYYAAGQTVTFGFSGSGSVEYFVNGVRIKGNSVIVGRQNLKVQIGVPYIDENGERQIRKPGEYTVLTSDVDDYIENGVINLNGGWYVVQGKVKYASQVKFSGEAHLILADGAKMEIVTEGRYENGINANGNLTIYGQNGQSDQSGTLKVTATGSGIYGKGTVTIIGGTVEASGSSYGIYGDKGVTIIGGTVTATSTNGPGIHGYNGVSISGGSVEAVGKYGIDGDKGVTIIGGTVTATGTGFYGIYSQNRDIILGWTNSTDSIKASSYKGSVQIAEGNSFKDEIGNVYSGTLTGEQLSAIKGKKLEPCYAVALDLQDGKAPVMLPAAFDENGVAHVAKPADPTRDGFSFEGWFTTKDGNTEFDFSAAITGNTTAYAKWSVLYIDEKGKTQIRKPGEYTVLTGNTGVSNLSGGWYVVQGEVKYSNQVKFSGDAHLILADGAKMEIVTEGRDENGINANGNLTIYGQNGQSDQSDQSGTLKVTATGCGIYSRGNITIIGGTVEATGEDYGIYGYNGVTINGGTVSATGYFYGIYSYSGDIKINGGSVTATCKNGDGIYSGEGNITINGGSVTATSTYGYNGVTISGGKVEASGSIYGIYSKKNVTINGGKVEASGSIYGIYSKKNVTINGGSVTASGNSSGIRTEAGHITLGWTNSTDSIKASSYYSKNGSVQIAEGKSFKDENGNVYSGTLSSTQLDIIKKKTLEPCYAVTIDAQNGDEPIMLLTTFDENGVAHVKKPNDPIRSGFTFEGWFTAKDGGTEFDFSAAITGNTTAYAKWSVPYIDEKGKPQIRKPGEYTVLTEVNKPNEDGVVELSGGWYVVEGEVKYSNQVKFEDDAHLILADGAKMEIEIESEYGIYASKNLTIYGQNGQRGILNASTTGTNGSGIYSSFGDITIIGGTVTATGDNDGIYSYSGDITIIGGTVTATGKNGYGIFGKGAVTIIGGKVTASGINGICSYSGDITISGGKVTASGYYDGIYGYDGVTISGGSVTATGTNGLGINSISGDITLGWTNSSDSIYASSYFSGNGSVKIAEGKSFKDDKDNVYSGPLTGGQLSAIKGKKLEPCYAVALDLQDGKAPVMLPAAFDENGVAHVKKPNDPTRDGFSFEGWFTAKDGNTEFDFSAAITGNTTAYAKWSVPYIDENGTPKSVTDFIVLTEDNKPNENGVINLPGGWYVVQGKVEYSNQVKFSGDAHLILADEAKLEIKTKGESEHGIYASKNLTIYGQNEQSGILNDTAKGTNGSGIYSRGNITIIGGKVTATSKSGDGIHSDNGVTISGGSVTATGSSYGIESYNNVTISGGSVTATGSSYGIYSDNGVTISGGSVTATGNYYGIYSDNGVTISGGSVTATGYYGIYSYNGVTISGGSVTATGYYGIYGDEGNITISGGTVTASGNSSGINAKAGHITLGWTNSTDSIKVSSIHLGADSCTVSIAEGKSFVDENGNEYRGSLTDENLESIKNKTLTPLMPFPDNIVIGNISGATYTGDSIRPKPAVTIGENVRLELGKDYTLAYKDNLNASDMAKVIVKGAGKYYGEVQKSFTIDKAPLKITALNDTIVYGDEPANQGVAYEGFVGNETSEVLKGELALEIGYKRYDDAGKYAITPSGLNADNYEIKFVAGTLTVEPKVISIVWGEQTEFAYDGDAHAPTVTAKGFVEGHVASLVVTGAAVNAGKHTAMAAFDENDANSKNYKLPATGLEKEFKIIKPIAYIDENGVEQTVTDYTVLTSDVTDYIENGVINLPGGWYVVEGEVKYTSQVKFGGDAHLILADGAKLEIKTEGLRENGIDVSGNLAIYGQSGQSGILADTAKGSSSNGIKSSGNVTISGGNVTVAGGDSGIKGASNVMISGGNVTATGSDFGIYSYKGITLGWTNSTDRIQASRYGSPNGNVVIAEGQAFKDENDYVYSGTLSVVQTKAIGGKTLSPLLSGVKVAFVDTQDGKEVTVTRLVDETGHVTAPDQRLRSGYTFVGWFTTAEGNTKFDFTSTITADTTVYAKWVKNALVEYIDEQGDTQTVTDYVLLTENTDVSYFPGGWYVVQGKVSYTNMVNFSGDAYLILADGAKMDVENGSDAIYIQGNLTIYGQSGQSGILTVASKYGHGIYCYGDNEEQPWRVRSFSSLEGFYGLRRNNGSRGYVTIAGGNVTATGYDGGIYGSNDITLSLNNNSSSFIKASSYYSENGNVIIPEGKTLKDEKGNEYSGTLNADQIATIAGQKLVPSSFNGKFLTDESVVVADIPVQKYNNGNPVCPKSILVIDGKDTLKAGTDYTFACFNNTAATSATLGESAPYVKITGMGKYVGEIEKRFYIWNNIRDYAAVQVFEDADGKTHAEIDGAYDGSKAVAIAEDIAVDTVKFNREFTVNLENGGFSTIMLPFEINAENLTGVKSIFKFDGVKTDKNGKSAVGVNYVWCNATIGKQELEKDHPDCNKLSGELNAYTPYMVEMETPTLGIKDNVTLKSIINATNSVVRKDNWVFRGALEKKEWSKEDDDIKNGQIWAFAGSARNGAKIGEFVQFGGNNWVNPFRAYLVDCTKYPDASECKDETQPEPSFVSRYRFADVLAPATSAENSLSAKTPMGVAASETASIESMDIVIVYGDSASGERPTVIGRMNPATGEIRMLPRTKQTYDLKGRKVGNGKKAKGAYYRR